MIHLQDFYNTNGENTFQQVFETQRKISIVEKINSSRIIVKKKNGNTKFYKNERTELTLIERLLSGQYEAPIKFLSEIEFPDNTSWYFNHVPNKMPVIVRYDNSPKNELVLTAGKIGEDFMTYKELKVYADRLNVESVNVVFEGTIEEIHMALNSFMKDEIKFEEFYNHLKIANGSSGTDAYKTCLNESINDSCIESLIITNKERLYKIQDPRLNEKIINSLKDRAPNDNASLLVLDFVEFYQEQNLDEFILNEEDFDDRYVELINLMFNLYLKENLHKVQGLKIESDFNSGSTINYDLIKNNLTVENIITNNFESVYKVLMGTFRKMKTSMTHIYDQNAIARINEIYEKIKDAIMNTNNSPKTFDVWFQNSKLILSKPELESDPIDEFEVLDLPRQEELVKKKSKEDLQLDVIERMTAIEKGIKKYELHPLDDEKLLDSKIEKLEREKILIERELSILKKEKGSSDK